MILVEFRKQRNRKKDKVKNKDMNEVARRTSICQSDRTY